jgi:hypothetical protein
MKLINLKLSDKDLHTIRDALLSDRAELNKIKENPNQLIKTVKKSHRDLILNREISSINKLLEYVEAKQKLFI